MGNRAAQDTSFQERHSGGRPQGLSTSVEPSYIILPPRPYVGSMTEFAGLSLAVQEAFCAAHTMRVSTRLSILSIACLQVAGKDLLPILAQSAMSAISVILLELRH
jgi:hypothetical protein